MKNLQNRTHGLNGTYTAGCRCAPCTTAHQAQQVLWREEARAIVSAAKDRPCARCGESYPAPVMDLHHTDESTKEFSIGHGAVRVSRARLRAEIEKCQVLCANCHRLLHYVETPSEGA